MSAEKSATITIEAVIPAGKRRLGLRLWPSLHFAVIAVISLFIVVPFAQVALSALKTPAEAASMRFSLPGKWVWSNFSKAFVEGDMLDYFGNSLIISVCCVSLAVVLGAMAAYVFARRKGLNGLFLFVLSGLITPPMIIPTVLFMQKLKLINAYSGMILFFTAILLPFCVFVLTGFIRSIPRELDEAAIVDGAGSIRLFFVIVFPLLGPAVATAAVFMFVNSWNDFLWPLFLLNDPAKWTLPLSVFKFVSKYQTQWHLVFANLLITIMPVILVYFAAQRFIIEGMTAGSVKG